MANYTEAQIEAAVLQMPERSRARIIGALLKSLSGPDEPWIEELQWRLQDWHAGTPLEPIDNLLDDLSLLDEALPAPEKSFDAVKMVREIRDKMSREMEEMTTEEKLAYINSGSTQFRERAKGES